MIGFMSLSSLTNTEIGWICKGYVYLILLEQCRDQVLLTGKYLQDIQYVVVHFLFLCARKETLRRMACYLHCVLHKNNPLQFLFFGITYHIELHIDLETHHFVHILPELKLKCITHVTHHLVIFRTLLLSGVCILWQCSFYVIIAITDLLPLVCCVILLTPQ